MTTKLLISLMVKACVTPFTSLVACFIARDAITLPPGPLRQEFPEEQIMRDLAQPYVQGLTLLGGEPFLNTGILIPLVKRIREELPEKDIWSWTGYTWEELMLETPDKLELLQLVDILVDGRFDITKKNLMLQFRGSSNQRIIDVKKSLNQGEVVIWDKLNDGQTNYEQVDRKDML